MLEQVFTGHLGSAAGTRACCSSVHFVEEVGNILLCPVRSPMEVQPWCPHVQPKCGWCGYCMRETLYPAWCRINYTSSFWVNISFSWSLNYVLNAEWALMLRRLIVKFTIFFYCGWGWVFISFCDFSPYRHLDLCYNYHCCCGHVLLMYDWLIRLCWTS